MLTVCAYICFAFYVLYRETCFLIPYLVHFWTLGGNKTKLYKTITKIEKESVARIIG